MTENKSLLVFENEDHELTLENFIYLHDIHTFLSKNNIKNDMFFKKKSKESINDYARRKNYTRIIFYESGITPGLRVHHIWNNIVASLSLFNKENYKGNEFSSMFKEKIEI